MKQTWQVSLSERIDPARKLPLYLQIIQAVIRDIESGRLSSGTYLPSSRELARLLAVNRKTVVLAYEDLIAQGWLVTTTTRGTMVSQVLPEARLPSAGQPSTSKSAGKLNYRIAAPPLRPLALPGGPGIKLDEGAPDGRLFPPEPLIRSLRSAIHKGSRENGFQYRDPRGTPELRSAIATMLSAQRGLAVNEENVCITRGSQNGIFLTSLALLEPGDAVIVEELTYEPAVATFKALGAEVIAVGLDEDGMNVAEIDQACRRHRVRAVFVTPHHQFPTTVAMRPDRRLALVELARTHGFAIIEDDYDHEFHFESQPLLPIAAYAPAEVIYVGSLSKLLLPALRIGYVAAPVPVIAALSHLVSMIDGMGSTLAENAVASLIENGEVRRHARKVRQIYADRRARFAAEIERVLGEQVEFRVPAGGLAFWLRFATDVDRLETRAARAGLRFARSRSFMTRDTAPKGLRLGFASLTPAEARAAIAALSVALR